MTKVNSLTAVLQKEESQFVRAGVLSPFLDYIMDVDNVWDKDKYLPKRHVFGPAFKSEASLNYTYVLGNAFMEGYMGNTKVRMYFQRLQGFQIYTARMGETINQDEQDPANFRPDDKVGVLSFFEKLVTE